MVFPATSCSCSKSSGTALYLAGENKVESIPAKNKTINKIVTLCNKKPAIPIKANTNCADFTILIIISFLYLSAISPAVAEKSKDGNINTAIRNDAKKYLEPCDKEFVPNIMYMAKAILKK